MIKLLSLYQMFNYKITIQYDGTKYAGWQIQENATTIQEVISSSIKQILQEEINLIGAGRTDAGVHALGQVANFNCTENWIFQIQIFIKLSFATRYFNYEY